MRQVIHKFKYDNFRALASPLARLLAGYWEARPLPVDIIVPVPLHARRLRERGYNQSALLAREMGKFIGLPAVEGALLRLENTPAQVKAINAEMRRENVREAFACCDGVLQGKRILLIDDICTTGATLDSCAKALKRGGADSVWGLTLAREV